MKLRGSESCAKTSEGGAQIQIAFSNPSFTGAGEYPAAHRLEGARA